MVQIQDLCHRENTGGPLGWRAPSCLTFKGALLKEIYPINIQYIRCMWGWLLGVPSQRYHHFPNDCDDFLIHGCGTGSTGYQSIPVKMPLKTGELNSFFVDHFFPGNLLDGKWMISWSFVWGINIIWYIYINNMIWYAFPLKLRV